FACPGLDRRTVYQVRVWDTPRGRTAAPERFDGIRTGERNLRFQLFRDRFVILGRVDPAILTATSSLQVIGRDPAGNELHTAVRADGGFKLTTRIPGACRLELLAVTDSDGELTLTPVEEVPPLENVMPDGGEVV